MSNNKFYRLSTVTGKSYNYFDTVKILNLYQSMFYITAGVPVADIKVGKRTTKDGIEQDCLIFYFLREDTKDAYDLWCKRSKEYHNEEEN